MSRNALVENISKMGYVGSPPISPDIQKIKMMEKGRMF